MHDTNPVLGEKSMHKVVRSQICNLRFGVLLLLREGSNVSQICRDRITGDHIVLGVDVGSTTVKAVVVDPHSRAIAWSEYRRHETRLADTLLALLVEIG